MLRDQVSVNAVFDSRALAHEERATDFFVVDSPVFKLGAGAAAAGVRPIAWFDSAKPLRSGWAWGQTYLAGARP